MELYFKILVQKINLVYHQPNGFAAGNQCLNTLRKLLIVTMKRYQLVQWIHFKNCLNLNQCLMPKRSPLVSIFLPVSDLFTKSRLYILFLASKAAWHVWINICDKMLLKYEGSQNSALVPKQDFLCQWSKLLPFFVDKMKSNLRYGSMIKS